MLYIKFVFGWFSAKIWVDPKKFLVIRDDPLHVWYNVFQNYVSGLEARAKRSQTS